MLPLLGLWSTVPTSVVRRGRRTRDHRPMAQARRGAPPPATPPDPAGADPGQPYPTQSYPALRSTPRAAPLDMPQQDLTRAPRAPRIAERGMALRRLVVVLGSCAVAALTGGVLVQILGRGGHPVLDWATIVLSTVLSAWVAFGFMTATAGFVVLLAARTRDARASAVGPGALRGRTAILLPAYNEDPGLILSAVEAIAEDLRRLDAGPHYDLFILSDTRDE
ncbi:MAG: hypothetical protein P4L73_21235, partial [Caulobacteraceae bacterium]|nr:hypothetical protein [Caulobacteraceae bacterium]